MGADVLPLLFVLLDELLLLLSVLLDDLLLLLLLLLLLDELSLAAAAAASSIVPPRYPLLYAASIPLTKKSGKAARLSDAKTDSKRALKLSLLVTMSSVHFSNARLMEIEYI